MVLPCEKCSDILQATLHEHFKCVKKLLQDGWDVDEEGPHSNTALQHAAGIPDHKMVALLLKAGADVNHADYLGHTAIFEADHRCMRLLLNAGADVNVTLDGLIDIDGDTPLHWASGYGRYKCVDMLIKAGADVNASNGQGDTVLMQAATIKCVDKLLNAGADVNASDCHGNTVLMRLATSRDGKNIRTCIQRLLHSGAHINLVNHSGKNALTKCLKQKITSCEYQERQMFLFAAGEKLDDYLGEIPDYLKDPELSPKHLCRKAIRKLLIDQNRQRHLFNKIPSLGLPSILESYLLYDFSLENEEDESSDESETSDDDDDVEDTDEDIDNDNDEDNDDNDDDDYDVSSEDESNDDEIKWIK